MANRRNTIYKNKSVKWNLGVYCRLSSEDGDNSESDSIKNQRDLIDYYLRNEDELKILDYYSDDGYSGTTFNRPEFKRMLSDVVSGKINAVIVKDLSRFGRNYIEVGKYIEHVFPLYNIRFIAINDNIDSFKDPSSINNIIVPFKNLMNDEYARDISNKVKSVLLSKSRKGEFVGGTTPYGYAKDPENIYQLIIDEAEAKNIKLIFKKFINGDGQIKICKYLNDNGYLCRKELQRRKKYKLSLDFKEEKSVYQWSKSTIGKVLTNETYLGHLIYNKTGSINYKNHKQVAKPKEEWIVVKNTHKPIISQEIFDKVQEIIKERNIKRKPPTTLSIYKYKLKCADCGRGMCRMDDFRIGRQSSNYYCRNYKTTSSNCSPHKIRTVDLDKIVLESIIMQVKLVINLENTIKKMNFASVGKQMEKQYLDKVNSVNNDIEKIKLLKKVSYEDWKFEKITKEEFLIYSKDYDEKIEIYNKEIKALEGIYYDRVKETKKDDYWIEHFKRNKKVKTLDKEIIDELIDVIKVHENGMVTIKFKYQDEYEKILEFIKEKEENHNG